MNCLDGTGIANLKQSLIEFTQDMPWYRECLPASWVKVKAAVLELARNGTKYINFDEFEKKAAEQGLDGDLFPVAVKFMHETGVIRYFGESSSSQETILSDSDQSYIKLRVGEIKRPISALGLQEELENFGITCSVNEVQSMIGCFGASERRDFMKALIFLIGKLVARANEGESERGSESNNIQHSVITSTIFISPAFMIDVMKGLIRHDRVSLHDYFQRRDDRPIIRRLNRLSVWGRLHIHLISFLWPSDEKSIEYWNSVKKVQEGLLWKDDVIRTKDDTERALALLEGFDLMVFNSKENEYLVPGLLKQSRNQISGDAFNTSETPFYLKYSYNTALPPGAFEALVVRIARFTSHIQFSPIAAVFYKLGHMGQLFCTSDASRSSLHSGTMYLTVRSSSKDLLKQVGTEVERMEFFFPGLIRCNFERELHDHYADNVTNSEATLASRIREFLRFVNLEKPNNKAQIREAAQVLILSDTKQSAEVLKRSLSNTKLGEIKLSVAVQLASHPVELQGNCRVVLVCMTPTVGGSKVSCAQLAEHEKSKRAIIPIIMPGYEILDFGRWWPDSMPELESHKLFVDLRTSDTGDNSSNISKSLVPQIVKYLEEWRTTPRRPDQLLSVSSLSRIQAQAAAKEDIIKCPSCALVAREADICNSFSRMECRKKWDAYVAKLNSCEAGESAEELSLIKCNDCSAEHRLSDLLSLSTLPAEVPCPICIENGSFAPGSFNVDDCRLLLNERDEHRIGTVTCPTCSGSSRIMDVVPPEVLGSYNWGIRLDNGKFSTQELVVSMLRELEFRTDLISWVDVAGGMGAGQDLFKEMLTGITHANVLLIFLSDAYINSPICQREFILASNLCKYMIPLLVPSHGDVQVDPSDGWTGNGAEDPHWWHHAVRVCKSNHDPDDCNRRINWSILGLYTPIKLFRVKEQNFSVLHEIQRRVLMRLNRSAKLNNNLIAAQNKLMSVLMWRQLALFVDDFQEYAFQEYADKTSSNEAQDIVNDLSKKDKDRIKAIFDLYDTDGSGSIDSKEIKAAMTGLGLKPSDEEILTFMADLDEDGSGTIDLEEFTNAMASKIRSDIELKDRLTTTYQKFTGSEDQSNKISFADLRRVADLFHVEHGSLLSDQEISHLIAVASPNGGGFVDLQTFFELMAFSGIEALSNVFVEKRLYAARGIKKPAKSASMIKSKSTNTVPPNKAPMLPATNSSRPANEMLVTGNDIGAGKVRKIGVCGVEM